MWRKMLNPHTGFIRTREEERGKTLWEVEREKERRKVTDGIGRREGKFN